MELLEVVPVFSGRDHRFLYGSSDAVFGHRCGFLPACVFDDCVYCGSKADLWRSCVWLAFAGLHYLAGQRRAVFLYGHPRTISGEDLHGGKETSDLYSQRKHFKIIMHYDIIIL